LADTTGDVTLLPFVFTGDLLLLIGDTNDFWDFTDALDLKKVTEKCQNQTCMEVNLHALAALNRDMVKLEW